MNSQTEKVRAYYNTVQKTYDNYWMNKENLAMHLGFWDKDTKGVHEALINENQYVANSLNITKNDIVLDAGCGVGGTAIWVAEKYGVKVIGVNIVEKQIEAAKKYAKERKIDHLVNFELKDYADTGFPNESFTKVYNIESFCHSPQKENVLKETYRLLKPEGKFNITDDFLLSDQISKEDRVLLNDWCEGWACPDLMVFDDVRKKLQEIGFKELESMDVSEKTMPSAKMLYHHCRRFFLLKSFLAKIRVISKEDFGNTVATINQYLLVKNKIALYGFITVQK